MVEITGNDYRISYDPTTVTITFRGILRLYGTDGYVSLGDYQGNRQDSNTSEIQEISGGYRSITNLLSDVINQSPACITLDISELQFLNSSGINVFSKFVITLREQQTIQLIIQGNQRLSWQRQILNNLKVLMPRLSIRLD